VDLTDPALIPYRLRTIRVGVQVTWLALAALLASHLMPGGTEIPTHIFFPLWFVAGAGAFVAALLPWDGIFRTSWGNRALFLWSLVDIVLITTLIAWVPREGPSLFLLYVLTTLFFGVASPLRDQLVLFAATAISYASLFAAGETSVSAADFVLRLGLLASVAMIASFVSRELAAGFTALARSRDEVELDKNLYQALLQAQSDVGQGVAVVDVVKERFVYVNEALCGMCGYSHSELLKMSYRDVVGSGSSDEGLLDPGDARDLVGLRRDGTRLVLEAVTKPIGDDRMIALLRDVTEERVAVGKLAEQQEIFRAVSELASDFVYSLRVEEDGTVVPEWATEAYARVTGTKIEDMAFDEWTTDLVHPDDALSVFQAFAECITQGRKIDLAFRLIQPGGDIRHLQIYGRAFRDQGTGRVIRIYGAVQDNTDQKVAFEATRQHNELLKAISELTSDYAFSLKLNDDGGSEWEWVTDGFQRVTGYTPEESTARGGWMALLHPQDLIKSQQVFAGLLAKPNSSTVSEARIQTKWGEIKHIRSYARTVWDPVAGRAARIFGAVEDITERKLTEQALRASEERYRTLFERMPIGLFLRTPEGAGVDANPACVAMFGYPDKETFLATPAWRLYVTPEDRARWMEAAQRGEFGPFDLEFRRFDGSTFWGSYTVRAVRDDDARQAGGTR